MNTNLGPTTERRSETSASTAALLFGLFGAPLAWAAQLSANFAMAASSCFDRGVALNLVRAVGWSDRTLLLALNFAALAVAIAAAIVSTRAYRSARIGAPPRAGVASTRALAAAGLMSCAVFAIATLFSLFVVFASPRCGG